MEECDCDQKAVFVPVNSRFQQVAQMAHRLAEAVLGGRANHFQFQSAALAIAALPLTTAEYAVARLRLTSAYQYICERESGAAAYELRLLGTSVGARSVPDFASHTPEPIEFEPFEDYGGECPHCQSSESWNNQTCSLCHYEAGDDWFEMSPDLRQSQYDIGGSG